MYNQMPPVTKNLLIINVLMYLATVVFQTKGIDLESVLGLHFVLASEFKVYQLFTYMFMHSGMAHIFFNMFAVWMFGRTLEYSWGSKRYLLFYIVCGIGAGLVQEIVQYIHYATTLAGYEGVDFGGGQVVVMGDFLNRWLTVGASGSVFGILIGFAMMYPNQELLIFPIPVPLKAKWVVIGYIALELFLGLANNAADNVAHFAHLGGAVFGFLLILYWKRRSRGGRYGY